MSARDIADLKKAGEMFGDPEEQATPVKKPEPPKPLARMTDTFRAAAEMLTRGAPKNPLRTGFTELDAGLRHMGPEEITMLAADSGIGKSTLSTQIALHTAMCGHGVVYLNLEMADAMYGLRTACNFVRIPTQRAASGDISVDEIVRLSSGFQKLKEPARRIVMGNSREHRTIPAVKALCVRAARELQEENTPVALVIVDHILQIMVNVRNDKDAEGKARADLLKEIAESLKCHVLALVHVTRDSSKGGGMPTKNQMASSAWFDRHADNILVFHQKRAPDGTFAPKEQATIACQKARWGNPFAVKVEYQSGFFFPWELEPGKAPFIRVAPATPQDPAPDRHHVAQANGTSNYGYASGRTPREE